MCGVWQVWGSYCYRYLLSVFPSQFCSNTCLFPNPAVILCPWQSICLLCGSADESCWWGKVLLGYVTVANEMPFIFPLFSSPCAAGIPDVVKGRVGSDSGRHLPWTHARAHFDEVHLHQPIWVRAPALSRYWGCCNFKSTLDHLFQGWDACNGLEHGSGSYVFAGSVQRYWWSIVLSSCTEKWDVMTAVIIRFQVFTITVHSKVGLSHLTMFNLKTEQIPVIPRSWLLIIHISKQCAL